MGADVVPSVTGQLTSVVDIVTSVGTDFFSFIVVVAIVGLFAFYFGGDRLLPLIAGLYTAIPLYTFFAYKEIVADNPFLLIGLYAVLVLLSVIAFSGLSYFMSGGALGVFKLIALSVLTAGLILAICIHILPIGSLYAFSEPTKMLFQSDQAFFWWLVAPLAGLFLFGRL